MPSPSTPSTQRRPFWSPWRGTRKKGCTFQVKVNGSSDVFEIVHANASLLEQPLSHAVIKPCLEWAAPKFPNLACILSTVRRVEVDGVSVQWTTPASRWVDHFSTVEVELTLDTAIPPSRARSHQHSPTLSSSPALRRSFSLATLSSHGAHQRAKIGLKGMLGPEGGSRVGSDKGSDLMCRLATPPSTSSAHRPSNHQTRNSASDASDSTASHDPLPSALSNLSHRAASFTLRSLADTSHSRMCASRPSLLVATRPAARRRSEPLLATVHVPWPVCAASAEEPLPPPPPYRHSCSD